MRRVLFLDHTPFAGGAELALLDHIRYLNRAHFEPQVACSSVVPDLVERFQSAGARTHVVDWPRLRQPNRTTVWRVIAAGRALRRIIRDDAIDLVVANTSRTAYIAAVALVGSSTPLVWWVRDFDFGRRWFRLLSRVPRRIVCVSNAVRAHYGGSASSKFSVVFVGNDLHDRLTAHSAEDLLALRSRLGVEPGDMVVGFMGRLVEGKGPEDLLNAVEQLRSEFPRLRLVFVGTGKGQDGDVEDRLRQRVIQAGLTNVVRMVGHRAEEALFYQMFDVFVLSSRYREAMPTSVIQAMMACKPVIATRTGGTPEVVADGETGILVSPHQPAAIADALRRVLGDPQMARRLAAAGNTHVMRHHRQEPLTRQVEAIYDSVLATVRPTVDLNRAQIETERDSGVPEPRDSTLPKNHP